MKKTLLPLILLLALLITACGESDYNALTDYQQAVSSPDSKLQNCLDEYNGSVLAVGQGYGIRLPMDSWRAEQLLAKAREARDELALVAIPEVASTVGEMKLTAANSIVSAVEELLAVMSLWEEQVPIGPPNMTPGAELEFVDLLMEDVHLIDADLTRVEEMFVEADGLLEDGALALAGALLKSRGE